MSKRKGYMRVMFVLLTCIGGINVISETSVAQLRERVKLDYPSVPRVNAYEVYLKYKAGRAIIIQAGGENFDKRHIMGAYNIPEEAVRKKRMGLPEFPKEGIEIFTYCY